MKAIVYTEYGPPEVLKLKDVPKPLPKDDEVLIKVHAVNATKGDCELRDLKIQNSIWLILRLFFGILKPRKNILGAYFAGEIEALGKDVNQLKVGDQVCGCTGANFGAYTQYVCMHQDGGVALKASNMSYEEASAVPLAIDALHFLRNARIKPGESVLINGAGGSIGTFAVQIAKYYGAHVTAVDSEDKLDMLRSIGADQVVDYTKEDFSERAESYDVIFDLICKDSYSRSTSSLKQNGRYLLANPDGISQMLRGLWTSYTSDKTVISRFADAKAEDLNFLRELIESGNLKTIIDRTYPLEQIVDAHKYIEQGNKIGNVVVKIN